MKRGMKHQNALYLFAVNVQKLKSCRDIILRLCPGAPWPGGPGGGNGPPFRQDLSENWIFCRNFCGHVFPCIMLY